MSMQAISMMSQLVAWTPTWVNFTMGASTTTGWYVRLGGRWIVFEAELIFGTGFAYTGQLVVPLPVTASGTPQSGQFSGRFIDADGSRYPMFVSGAQQPTCWFATGTYVARAYPDASIPFTWVAGDSLHVHGKYLAASVV